MLKNETTSYPLPIEILNLDGRASVEAITTLGNFDSRQKTNGVADDGADADLAKSSQELKDKIASNFSKND